MDEQQVVDRSISIEPYSAHVVLDSISPCDVRLTTLQVTFPRFILAEFNTHRVFSRNSASSRAIPVSKRIRMIQENPYIPLRFGSNIKGMQAGEDIPENSTARDLWLTAMQDAVKHASKLAELGVHKQWANRLLEPFAWHTVIVTSTEWSNFFAQRQHKDAQPEIQLAAKNMFSAMEKSTPHFTEYGQWHLPFVYDEDWVAICDYCSKNDFTDVIQVGAQVSCGRAARVSYLTHDGKRDINKDIELCWKKLVPSGHMSPLEHAAECHEADGPVDLMTEFIGNFKYPWKQYRKTFENEDNFGEINGVSV